MNMTNASPVDPRKRIVILDALRGFALLGIVCANFPEFSLWSFMSGETREAIPYSAFDKIVNWLLYIFIDGKFYTIFSILFGIGFSIIIERARSRGANGMAIFHRRMILLLLIGVSHMLFLWSGDILTLYAAMGLLLPLFSRCDDKTLLRWALFFLLLPVIVEVFRAICGDFLSSALYDAWWNTAAANGINEENFATWLRDATDYPHVFAFLCQGAVERMWEFVVGSRYFKVLGLFLIGFYIGRRKIFYHLDENRHFIEKTFKCGMLLGLPLSLLYAWSSMLSHPLGNVAHAVFYFISVYPLGFSYIACLVLLYMKRADLRLWTLFAYPGRMALTCYIAQSLFGIVLFYGIGFGLGTSVCLLFVILLSISVFAFETFLCALWLRRFRFGPIEWVWRMLTYGKWFSLRLE